MKKIIIAAILFFIICIGAYSILADHEGFDITIKNQTGQKISGLYITYEHITSDLKIPAIPSGKKYQVKVTPTEEFSENTMSIYYEDHSGNKHTKTVIGYFEKGYSGEAVITLKSIDDNGLIKMKVIQKR